MQLRQPEALRCLDDHQRGIGHIHPHLDHRRRHQHGQPPGSEIGHHRILVWPLHLAVDKANTPFPQPPFQERRAGGRCSFVRILGAIDQRTHPIGLPTAFDMAGKAGGDILEAGGHPRFDGLATGRALVDLALIHFAKAGEREAARNRRRGHRQHVRRHPALVGQHQPLGDAEAVLFIHHHQAQIIIGDRFLEDGVGANKDIDPARCQISQQRLARLALVAAGEQFDPHRQTGGDLGECRMMLTGEDFGRRQQGRLRSRFHRGEHGDQADHRLARTHVALQQSQHRLSLRHVAGDFADHAILRIGQLPRQAGDQRLHQPAIARQCPPAPRPRIGPHQQ